MPIGCLIKLDLPGLRQIDFNPEWIAAQGLDLTVWEQALDHFDRSGVFEPRLTSQHRE